MAIASPVMVPPSSTRMSPAMVTAVPRITPRTRRSPAVTTTGPVTVSPASMVRPPKRIVSDPTDGDRTAAGWVATGTAAAESWAKTGARVGATTISDATANVMTVARMLHPPASGSCRHRSQPEGRDRDHSKETGGGQGNPRITRNSEPVLAQRRVDEAIHGLAANGAHPFSAQGHQESHSIQAACQPDGAQGERCGSHAGHARGEYTGRFGPGHEPLD